MALLLLLGTTPSKAATLGLYCVPTLLNLSGLRILGAKLKGGSREMGGAYVAIILVYSFHLEREL